MRALFCVDSNFQLILAIDIRLNVYPNDEADLVVCNTMPNAKSVAERARKVGAFSRVFLADGPLLYLPRKASVPRRLNKIAAYVVGVFSPSDAVASALGVRLDAVYHHFLFNGRGAFPECLYNCCYRNNPDIVCYRFEDGFASLTQAYTKKSRARRCIESLLEIFAGRHRIESNIAGYYFLNPSLIKYQLSCPVLRCPPLDRGDTALMDALNAAFEYSPLTKADYQDAKVLFFDGNLYSDSSDALPERDAEFEAVQIIADMLPRDQIVVKAHPRRTLSRYETLGVRVTGGDGTPWELCELNCDFRHTIMVTFLSSAVFWSETLFNNPCPKIMLYRTAPLPPNVQKDLLDSFIASYKEENPGASLLVPDDFSEFKEELRKFLARNSECK